jgi:alanine dehydrogenase
VLFWPGHADEFDQPVAGVIGEPVGLRNRDDPILVSRECLVLAAAEVFVATVSVDQAGLVEAIAAHHAADGVGEEASGVFFAVRTVERDLFSRDFWEDFVL